jgi:hypothetical protein
MALRIPDLLTREIRHHVERFQDRAGQLGLRRWVNESSRLILGVTVMSALVLAVVAARAVRLTLVRPFPQGKTAWFYDVNTDRLFLAGSKQTGPIGAPSGLARDGGPAGFRAYVYSYVLDPNEADLFVGFIERPDSDAGGRRPTSDMRDVDTWAQGRLIKRVKDKQWVQARSPQGQAILQELVRPNKKGQTPIYQTPR